MLCRVDTSGLLQHLQIEFFSDRFGTGGLNEFAQYVHHCGVIDGCASVLVKGEICAELVMVACAKDVEFVLHESRKLCAVRLAIRSMTQCSTINVFVESRFQICSVFQFGRVTDDLHPIAVFRRRPQKQAVTWNAVTPRPVRYRPKCREGEKDIR